VNSLAALALGAGVSGIWTRSQVHGLECFYARLSLFRLTTELLGLASPEKFERGFDAFVLAGVGVSEELVDLEPTKFSAGHVAGGTPSASL
jgi:hypothetical protein